MTIQEYITVYTLAENEDDNKKIEKSILELHKDMKLIDAKKKLADYYEALNKKSSELVTTFELDGIEFGLIPDLTDITTGEFLDLDNYQNDIQNIHRFMSVLYRPVKYKLKDKYIIEEYEGSDKYSKEMLKVDISIYKSVLSFFLTLHEIIRKDTHTYIK